MHVGEHVRTGVAGRARALLSDGSVLVLGENTQLIVQQHDDPALPEGHTRVVLPRGTVRAVVAQVQGDARRRLEIATDAALVIAHGTELIVRHDRSAGVTEVITIGGRVEVRGAGGAGKGVVTAAGERTRVRPGDTPSVSVPLTRAEFQRYLDQVEFVGAAARDPSRLRAPLLTTEALLSAPRPAAAAAPQRPQRPRTERTSVAAAWTVQVAAFPRPEPAGQVAAAFRAKGYAAEVRSSARDGEPIYRVRIGRYTSKAEAQQVAARVRREAGVPDAFVAAD